MERTMMRAAGLAVLSVTLALAGIAGAPARAAEVDWAKAEPVTVVMTEYVFLPSRLTFRRGVPYRLHLDNRGKELHEFTAPEFLKSAVVRNPEVLANEGKEVVLQPHEAKDLYFVAKEAGRFPLSCADHDWEGMTGEITVE